MPYQGRQPGVGVRNRFLYTATASQTTFSGADDNGRTLAYQDGAYVDVYLNGVMLVPGTDFTATTKTSVSLTSGAAASDIVEIIAYDISSIADTVSALNGGSFGGAVAVSGNLTVDTNTLFVDAANNSVGVGTSSPSTYGLFSAVGSTNGFQSVSFVNTSNGASAVNRIQVGNDASAGAGQIVVYGSQHSTLANVMDVNNATSAALRLLTNNAERLRIDASGNVGIGDNSPADKLVVNKGSAGQIATFTDGVNSNFVIETTSLVTTVGNTAGSSSLAFKSANTERMRITAAGNVGIGTSTPSATFAVNGGFSFAQRGNFQGSQNVGTMLTSTGGLGGAECMSTGAANAAFMAFHRPGGFATYFGLDTDNNMAVGGWSAGAGLVGFKCGPLSKTSGSFKIDHPLKPDTHHLVHSFIEGPQADNIYRGKVALVDGSAVINIDTVAGMTEGTFAALNRDIQCFTSNETGWCNVRGSVVGNILTIEAQDNTCTDTISWLVIGERQDQHMYETNWTDENGKVIVEPLKKQTETE
jgi:hypothetical protein